MLKACCLVVGWMLAAGALRADWKITTASVDESGESVRTEYYKGDLQRTDQMWRGQVRPVTVYNVATGTYTMWDATRKMYMTVSPQKARPASVPLPVADTATAAVELTETNTVDTGERQTMLGRTAKHYITTVKQFLQDTPAADEKLQSESLKDEWYVDAAGLTHGRYGALITTMILRGGQLPTMRTSHTGPVPTGMLIRQKITWGNGKLAKSQRENRMEVTELVEGPLPENLFAPPADFKRVDRLPDASFTFPRTFGDEIETYWNSFENWLFGWFS